MDKKLNDRVKYVWNEMVPPTGRHTEGTNIKELNLFYDRYMLPDFVNYKNKIIVNYGCGGGFLEKRLFEKQGIKKAYGLDISEKSIEFARKNLKGKNVELFLIEPSDMMRIVRRRKKDIFFSCECIQHFPTKEYFDAWLKMLNNQKYEWIILHYKTIDKTKLKKTQFRENIYKTLVDSNRACITETKFLKDRLTNYELIEIRENIHKEFREATYWKIKK